ncbi:MAG: histidine triad nucleotide-binding protein [Candidatus Latescibacteria bacterium]|nr:histidine triad nucleotide-binding protein [Candidatus Latescibacterota bacterium]
MADCIFCKIIDGEISASIVYSDDRVVAFNDVNPQAPVHVIIVPRQHIPTVADLGPETSGLMDSLTQTANRIAQERGIASRGYRLVVNCNAEAGQSVYHLHLHLLGGRPMTWPPG